MKTVTITWIILLFLSYSNGGSAQEVEGGNKGNYISRGMEESFKLRVKQLDEFMKRFNCTIDYEGHPIEHCTYKQRGEAVFRLFNAPYLQSLKGTQQEEAKQFIRSVANESNHISIDYYDQNWFAELTVTFVYQGNRYEGQILMEPEVDEREIAQWTIKSIQAPFMDLTPIDSTLTISPIAHEMNFGKLVKGVDTNPENVAAYAYTGFKEDQLSIGLFLLKNGLLKLQEVKHIKYHFLQVPQYIFTVEHFERKSDNVGWLISEVIKTTSPEQKKMYTSQWYE